MVIYLLAASIKGIWKTSWGSIADCRVDRGRSGSICHITVCSTAPPFPRGNALVMHDRHKVTPWYLACGNRTLECLKLYSSCHPSLLNAHLVVESVSVRKKTDCPFATVTKNWLLWNNLYARAIIYCLFHTKISTAPQYWRSRVRFPVGSLETFKCPNPSVRIQYL
jgi:hypothetical protein